MCSIKRLRFPENKALANPENIEYKYLKNSAKIYSRDRPQEQSTEYLYLAYYSFLILLSVLQTEVRNGSLKALVEPVKRAIAAEAPAVIARFSNCSPGIARAFLEKLPATLAVPLYEHQARRLVAELKKIQVRALAIPIAGDSGNA